MAADQVVHFDGLVFGHPEADHPLVAAFDAGLHLVGRQRQRRGQLFAHGIIVGERFAALLGFAAQGVQLFGGVESVVGPARIDELEGVFEVDFAAFALAVGGVGTSRADAFVDLDSAPFERFEDILFGARHETLRVGVLDAEDHHTAVRTPPMWSGPVGLGAKRTLTGLDIMICCLYIVPCLVSLRVRR